ncbi:MAG TPA: type IV toxin-antitoxin system AbiEi family antitoxin domain-containing protein [Spirochaetia bacterium]|nr:type IV toxin-antitoxin system AbiEi family antitoxin domain-containing protein [Spirochaetia bacterium]
MDYSTKLEKLIQQNSGVISTKDVTEAGIPRTYLSEFVKRRILERLERGVYITKDCHDDEMYRLQIKYEQAIFSHDTALFLHDLTDRDPIQHSVTVKTGYNTKNIKASGVKVYTIKKELYDLGLISTETPFNRAVKTYDMERTICDIVRSRSQMDIVVLTDALRRYTKRKDKNLPQLMRYADKLRITNVLRKYLEVLL